MSHAQIKPHKPGSVRVLWGVDPFDSHPEVFAKCIESFDYLNRRVNLDVMPVYYMQSQRYNWSGDYSGEWISKYQPLAEQGLKDQLSGFKKEYLLEPQVLINRGKPDEDPVPALDIYASRHRFDWIALTRHAKSGADRFFTGSFTEDMLSESRHPLLIFEPYGQACHWEEIFFPTDFSEGSDELLEQVIDLAVQFKARLTVVHKIINPIEPFVQSGVLALGGGWVSLPAFVEEQTAEIEEKVKQWKLKADTKGLRMESVIDSSPATISDILKELTTTQPSSLIITGTQASPLRSWLSGSVGRQIVRSSHSTVLIQHLGAK